MYASVRRRLLVLMALVVTCDLTIGWLEPQVDNFAHAGGFIVGLVVAALLTPRTLPVARQSRGQATARTL
jgi:membrane associated rhomboid family serine protease